jgi:hypothetical protein
LVLIFAQKNLHPDLIEDWSCGPNESSNHQLTWENLAQKKKDKFDLKKTVISSSSKVCFEYITYVKFSF